MAKKGQKKSNLIWPFFKNRKSMRSWKKAKNYKFGLKKAKLATLAFCVCWIVPIVTCKSGEKTCGCSCLKCTWSKLIEWI